MDAFVRVCAWAAVVFAGVSLVLWPGYNRRHGGDTKWGTVVLQSVMLVIPAGRVLGWW